MTILHLGIVYLIQSDMVSSFLCETYLYTYKTTESMYTEILFIQERHIWKYKYIILLNIYDCDNFKYSK